MQIFFIFHQQNGFTYRFRHDLSYIKTNCKNSSLWLIIGNLMAIL